MLHILAAVGWAGCMFFLATALVPSLGRKDAAALWKPVLKKSCLRFRMLCWILLAVMVVLVGRMVVQAQTRPPATGREALVGRTATARTAIDGEGKVFLNGEYWDAIARESIAAGEQVRVLSVDGLTLSVERAAESTAQEGAG